MNDFKRDVETILRLHGIPLAVVVYRDGDDCQAFACAGNAMDKAAGLVLFEKINAVIEQAKREVNDAGIAARSKRN